MDYLHKHSRELWDRFDAVCTEDLNMQGMSQSLNFGKSVADNGWNMFTTFLQYKFAEQGKPLVKIDKWFPSSQLCHACVCKYEGTKDLSVRECECPSCHTHVRRDRNAAHNIRDEGKRQYFA